MYQEKEAAHSPTSPTESDFVKLKTVEHEIGITRTTLRKYLQQLGIRPRSFHIVDRSLYISQDEKDRIKKLKQNPALLHQLKQRPAR